MLWALMDAESWGAVLGLLVAIGAIYENAKDNKDTKERLRDIYTEMLQLHGRVAVLETRADHAEEKRHEDAEEETEAE